MSNIRNQKQSRYVICGGSGFVGRNLAERLGRLYPGQVVATHLSKPAQEVPGVGWRAIDLRDQYAIANLIEEGDIIIQAAAVSTGAGDVISRPHLHVTDNVIINSLLLRAAHDLKAARFIFFSCAVMYPSGLGRPLKETDFKGEISAASPHFGSGWTKVYIEHMCRFYAGLGNLTATVIRHSNTFGPHDKYDPDRSHMFAATVDKVMRTPDGGVVTVWGPGTEGRDLIYIDNVVDFACLALEQETPFELVNVGQGRAFTVNEVVEKIIAASGKRLIVEHDLSRPHVPMTVCLDSSVARRLYGWRPEVPFEEGIKRTLKWYKENRPNG